MKNNILNITTEFDKYMIYKKIRFINFIYTNKKVFFLLETTNYLNYYIIQNKQTKTIY